MERKRRQPRACQLATTALSLAILGGCAPLEPVFPPVEPAIVWPRFGDTARYAWVGSIQGEGDLKAPRSFWSLIVDFWAGPAPKASMERPSGVVVTDDGVLFVTDTELGSVHRFDIESREYTALTDAGAGRRFETPLGLATDGESILVADRTLGAVAVLTQDGSPARLIGSGRLEAPVDVVVGPVTGRIYVVDIATHEVRSFDADGEPAVRFGGRGTSLGEFNYPTHVACDSSERIYVTDSMNCRIQVFDPTGKQIATWGQRGVAPGRFSRPKGISCDRAGRIYVVDSHFENVQVFSARGELLLAFGEEGSGPGEFWLPMDVFVDGSDHIWVADAFNRRVQVFRYVGEDPESNSEGEAAETP